MITTINKKHVKTRHKYDSIQAPFSPEVLSEQYSYQKRAELKRLDIHEPNAYHEVFICCYNNAQAMGFAYLIGRT